MGRPSKYPDELRERAVRMVAEVRPQYPSQWAAIESIAGKIGCTAETLRKWVRQGERDSGVRPGATTAEQQRIKELERELQRKEKALAETAALLVLSKKVAAIFNKGEDA